MVKVQGKSDFKLQIIYLNIAEPKSNLSNYMMSLSNFIELIDQRVV